MHNHLADLEALERELPSGSGIDNGTKIDIENSEEDVKLVIDCGYHHMDENGYYDGWCDYTITVRPTFSGIWVDVDCNSPYYVLEYPGTTEYLAETYRYALLRELNNHML